MGDMGDYFRDMKEASKTQRELNRNNALKVLQENDINFLTKNNGAHLIVSNSDNTEIIDYWPGTGKWISRGTCKKHHGLKELVGYIKK